MRLAIISDIHGNYQALQAILADLAGLAIDEVISLGDNIGYGPEPEEVVATLRERAIPSVLGNHDYALLNQRAWKRLNPDPQRSLELTAPLLSPASREYIEKCPPVLLAHGARFVHGAPPAAVGTYLINPSASRVEGLLSTFPEQICFFGHTHELAFFHWRDQTLLPHPSPTEPLAIEAGSRYLLNAGSVGQPRDHWNKLAKYLIWDRAAQTIEARAIPYRVEETVRKLRALGFPAFNANRLL